MQIAERLKCLPRHGNRNFANASVAIRLVLLATVLSHCATTRAAADEYEGLYLNQLRSRQLFALAERYCEDTLNQQIPDSRRAFLAAELSRTLLEHAKYKSSSERELMWSRGQSVLSEESTKLRDVSLKTRLTVQSAVNRAHEATFLRWQATVNPQNAAVRSAAVQRVALAVNAVNAALRSLEADKSTRVSDKDRLRDTLQLHHANALLDRARLEADDSADRIGYVTQAEPIASRLVSRGREQQVRIDARVLYAECARMRGNGARGLQLLEEALQLATSPSQQDQIFAERIRLLLYEQRPDQAAEEVIRYRKQRGSLSGELHVERTRVLIALWRVARAASNDKLAEALLKQLETGVRYAQQEVGGYWAYRCERLLDGIREVGTLGPELAALKQRAEREYGEGDLAVAAKSFGDAAAMASNDGRGELASHLYYNKGSIHVQQKEMGAAADAFLAAHTAAPNGHSSAHLMWAWCLGQQFQQRATRERRVAYTAALEEHRKLFPDGEGFAEATYLLAALEETRLQNTKAVELFGQIEPRHENRYDDATAGLARCYAKIIQRLRQLRRPELLRQWQDKAVSDLQSRVARVLAEPDAISEPVAEFAVYAADILARGARPDYERASRLLSLANTRLSGVESTDRVADLRSRAEQVQLVIATAAGTASAGSPDMKQLSGRSAGELLTLLESLRRTSANNAAAAQKNAAVRLQIAELANNKRSDLSVSDRQRLDLALVRVSLENAQRDRAVRVARDLAGRAKDFATLAELGTLLESLRTKSAVELARRIWKQAEGAAAPGSESWIRARLHITRCTFALGEFEECRKLLRVTRLLYPELGTPGLRAEFEKIETQLAAKP